MKGWTVCGHICAYFLLLNEKYYNCGPQSFVKFFSTFRDSSDDFGSARELNIQVRPPHRCSSLFLMLQLHSNVNLESVIVFVISYLF